MLVSGKKKKKHTFTSMHSRKKLQKKETSAPIPKKYLEYEVSQGGVVRGITLIETIHPGQAL